MPTVERVDVVRFRREEVVAEETALPLLRRELKPLLVGIHGHALHNRPQLVVAEVVRFEQLSALKREKGHYRLR